MKEKDIFDRAPRRPVFDTWVAKPKEQWTNDQLAEWEHKMQAYADEVASFSEALHQCTEYVNHLACILSDNKPGERNETNIRREI